MLLLSVCEQKVPKSRLRGSERNFRFAAVSVRRLYLRRPIQEQLSFTVRRIAAFDLLSPSYALTAFAVWYGWVFSSRISAPRRGGGAACGWGVEISTRNSRAEARIRRRKQIDLTPERGACTSSLRPRNKWGWGKPPQALPVADEARRFRGSGAFCGLLAKAAKCIAATVMGEQGTLTQAAKSPPEPNPNGSLLPFCPHRKEGALARAKLSLHARVAGRSQLFTKKGGFVHNFVVLY